MVPKAGIYERANQDRKQIALHDLANYKVRKGDRIMKIAVIHVVSIMVLSFFAVAAFGADPAFIKNYSADMETTSSQGSFTSKVFFKDGKMRMEGAQGRKTINIIRPDKKVIWMLMVDSKTYMEIPLDISKEDIQSKLRDPNIKTDKEFIGNEVVDKHPTKKYHLTITTDGKKEKSGYIWEATDLNNFTVKYQSEDKKIQYSSFPQDTQRWICLQCPAWVADQ